uniref:Uncharacterized protein n=1 Tax=Parascaris univalens TaxID=6257 RepID=A0A915BN91_PARUN
MEAWLTNVRDANSQNRYCQPRAIGANDWTLAIGTSQSNNMASCGGTSHFRLHFNRYEMVESMPVRLFQSKSGVWDEPTDKRSVFVHFFWDCLEGAVKLIATDGVNMLINKFITATSISFIQRSKNFVQFDCDTSVSNTLYGFGFNCAEDVLPFMLCVIHVFTNPPEILSERAWTLRVLSSIPRSAADSSASTYMRNTGESSPSPLPPKKTSHRPESSTDMRSLGSSVIDPSSTAATALRSAIAPTKPSTVPTYHGSPATFPYGPLAGISTSVATSMVGSLVIGDTSVETARPWKQYSDETPLPKTPWQMLHANTSPNGHSSANSGLLKKPAPIHSCRSTDPVAAQTSLLSTEMTNPNHVPTFVPQNGWSCADWPSQVPLVDDMLQSAKGSLQSATVQPVIQSANISDQSIHAPLQGDVGDCMKSIYHGSFNAENGLPSNSLSLVFDTPEKHFEIPTKEYVDNDRLQWEMLLAFSSNSLSVPTPIGSSPKQSVMDPTGTPQSACPVEPAPEEVSEKAQKDSGEDLNDFKNRLEEVLLRLKSMGLSSSFEDDGMFNAEKHH